MKKKLTITLALLMIVGIIGCVYGCTPTQVTSDVTSGSEEDKMEPSSGVAIDWSMETDCSICHTSEHETMSDTAFLANEHSDNSCTTCHNDEVNLATVHEEVSASDKMPTKLRKSDMDENMCLGCHDSYESLAVKTADSTALTDNAGTIVNPHDLPSSTDHDRITCSDCHSMHTEKTAEEVSQNTCLSCHHEHIYECGTCH